MPLTRDQFQTLVATALADNATGGITAQKLRETLAEIAAGAVWAGDALMSVREVATTVFDPVAARAANNEVLRCVAPGSTVVTLPADAAAPLPAGWMIHAVAEGGAVEFRAGYGVTLALPDHVIPVTDRGYALTAWKAGSNTWRIAGQTRLNPANRFTFDHVLSRAPQTVGFDWLAGFVELTAGGVVTAPSDSTLDCVVGARTTLCLAVPGVVTLAGGTGVTLAAPAGRALRLSAEGAVVHLAKLGADRWRAWGDLDAA